MAGKKQLPPVRLADDSDIPSPPRTLSQAIEQGSRLDELRAMRRILAAHIESDQTLARDLAALTRQVREISREVESLEAQEEDARLEDGSKYDAADEAWKPKAI